MTTTEGRARRLMTLEQFERLPASDDLMYELSEGVLVCEPRPGRPHGTAAALAAHHLVAYALERGGFVTTETGYVLGENPATVRGPDVAYTRSDNVPYGKPAGFIRGAPDLAVEVISPTNRWAEIQAKIRQYFEAGSQLVWIVHPETRSVVVHTSSGASRTLGDADTLDGGEALPGFRLEVAQLFRF